MKKSLVAIFAVVIIVIVVLAGALELGLLNISSSSSNNSTTTAKNAYAPNVVASSDLNSSLGGAWSHTGSGFGSAANISSVLSLLYGGTVAGSGTNSVQFSPAVTVQSPAQSVYGNISSFEFSIFAPNHAGFAGVAIANYRNQADVNATYSYIDAKITPMQNSTLKIAKGNISGYDYIYAWYAVHSLNLTPNNQYASLLIGHYKAHLIAIFYLTPTNLSQAKFASLYESEVNILAAQNNSPPKAVLVSATDLGNYIGGTWESMFGITVQVQNASFILHELSSDLGGLSQAETQLVYQVVGNLTGLAVQYYAHGTSNATVLAFAKFANHNVPYALYLDLLTLMASGQNTSTGNVSGAQYTFMSYYYGKTMYNPVAYSESIIAADYGGYLIFGLYNGANNVTQSQFANVLKAEVGLL